MSQETQQESDEPVDYVQTIEECIRTTFNLRATPQAIFDPDAGIVRRHIRGNLNTPQRLRWSPTAYDFEDQRVPPNGYNITFSESGEAMNGCPGGKARCLAVKYLSQTFPGATLVPMSKFEIPASDPLKQCINPPTNHFEVNADYLRRVGIDPERIVAETESTTIFEGLIEMLRMCEEREITDAVFVTNDYNVPRAQAMLNALLDREKGVEERLKYLIATSRGRYREILGAEICVARDDVQISVNAQRHRSLTENRAITIVAAEQVLPLYKSLYGRVIKKAQSHPGYKKFVAKERFGAQQIEDGTYGKQSWINRQKN